MEPSQCTEMSPANLAESIEPMVEAKDDMDSRLTPPAEFAVQSVAPVVAAEVPSPQIKDQQSPSSLPPVAASTTPTAVEVVNKASTIVGDTVDAPVSPSTLVASQEAPLKEEEIQIVPAEKAPEKEEQKMEEVRKTETEEQETSTRLQPSADVAAAVTPVSVEEETAAKMPSEVSQPTPPTEEPDTPHIQTSAPSTAPEPEPAFVERAEPLLSNGLPQDSEELSEDSDTTCLDKPNTSQSQDSTPVAKTIVPALEEVEEKKEVKEKEEALPASVSCPPEKSTMQGK